MARRTSVRAAACVLGGLLMAGVWADSFNGWFSNAQILRAYDQAEASLGGGSHAVGAFGPDGGPGIRFSGDYSYFVSKLNLASVSGDSPILEGFVRISLAPSVENVLVTFYDGTDIQCTLKVTTSRTVRAYRGAPGSDTALGAASTYAIPLNAHVRLVIAPIIGNAGSFTVKVWEDAGTLTDVLTLTPVDTQATATAICDGFDFGACNTGNTDWASLTFQDRSGTRWNDILSRRATVLTFAPEAAGLAQGWTAVGGGHAAVVADTPADDNTSYLSASTIGVRELLDLEDVPLVDGVAFVVLTATLTLQSGAGSGHLAPAVRQGSTTTVGAAVTAPGAYAVALARAYQEAPNTTAFTASLINGLQWGVDRTGSAGEVRVTQIALHVVVFKAAITPSCTGGVLSDVPDPDTGLAFEGIGPHEDRIFIETDLDEGTERWALQTAMRDSPALAAHPDYKEGRVTAIGSLIRRTTGRLGGWQASTCRWSTDDHDRLVRGFFKAQHWYGREFRVYLAKREQSDQARCLGRFFTGQYAPTHPFSADIEGLDVIGSEFSPLALNRDLLAGFVFDAARFPQAPRALLDQEPPQAVPVYMGRWSDEGSDGPPPVLAGTEARGSYTDVSDGRFRVGFANQPAGSPPPPDSVSGNAVAGGSIPLGRTPYNRVYAQVWAVTAGVEGDPAPFYPELLEIVITGNNQQIAINWTFAGTDPNNWRIALAVKYYGARWNQVLEVAGTARTAAFTNLEYLGHGAITPGATLPYNNRKEFAVLAVMLDGRTTVCTPTGMHPYGGPYKRKPYVSWLPVVGAIGYEVYTGEVPTQYFGWSQRFVVSAGAVDADGFGFFTLDWDIAGEVVDGLPTPLGMVPVFESGRETIASVEYIRYTVARWPFHRWLGIRAGGVQIKDHAAVKQPDGTWPFAERYRLVDGWACATFYVNASSPLVEAHRDGSAPFRVNACTTEDVGNGTGSTISHSPRAVRFLWERLVIQDHQGVAWGASPTFADGIPMVRGSDYASAELMQIARIGGNGYAARIALLDATSLGQFAEFVVQSYGLHHGIGAHGQIRAGHYDDAVDTTVGYPHFTDIRRIKGPIRITPRVEDYENAIPYQWDYRPVDRSYAIRMVTPSQVLKDDAAITRNFGKRRTGPLRSLPYAADQATVDDVMQRNLLLGRFVNEWVDVPTDLDGLTPDLFSIIAVTDAEGTGASGYQEEFILVLEHEVIPGDPSQQRPTIVVLKGLNITALADAAWVWGPDALTTWDAMTAEEKGIYGAWASDADVIPTPNDAAKEWR